MWEYVILLFRGEDKIQFLFLGDILAFKLWKLEKLGADMSGSIDNTCRGCCSALMLLPRLGTADIAERFSSHAVIYWVKPDQGQTCLILSHGTVNTGSLGLPQPWWSQCILHEVLNEYKNTQIHRAENECNLNAKPLCCGHTWATTLEEDVCSVPASLNPTAQSLQLAHKVEKEQKKVRRWNEMQLEREKLCR